MSHFRKCAALVFVLALFFTGASFKTEAAGFADVPVGHWAEKEIDYLTGLGVLKGRQMACLIRMLL